jgi:hypothetical protein
MSLRDNSRCRLQAEAVRQAETAAATSAERQQQLELRTAERAARVQRRYDLDRFSHSATDCSGSHSDVSPYTCAQAALLCVLLMLPFLLGCSFPVLPPWPQMVVQVLHPRHTSAKPCVVSAGRRSWLCVSSSCSWRQHQPHSAPALTAPHPGATASALGLQAQLSWAEAMAPASAVASLMPSMGSSCHRLCHL